MPISDLMSWFTQEQSSALRVKQHWTIWKALQSKLVRNAKNQLLYLAVIKRGAHYYNSSKREKASAITAYKASCPANTFFPYSEIHHGRQMSKHSCDLSLSSVYLSFCCHLAVSGRGGFFAAGPTFPKLRGAYHQVLMWQIFLSMFHLLL